MYTFSMYTFFQAPKQRNGEVLISKKGKNSGISSSEYSGILLLPQNAVEIVLT
jgi:hypothetical protein